MVATTVGDQATAGWIAELPAGLAARRLVSVSLPLS